MSSPKMQYSKKVIEDTLALLYLNKGDLVKTSEQSGISISEIQRMKKEAFRINDIVRVKQSKEFLEIGHSFLIKLIKSREFKEQVKAAPLKEVTDFVIKLIDKLKEYQESLGIMGLKLEDVNNDSDEDSVGKSRKPEELGKFSLVGQLEEKEKSNEVKEIIPPQNSAEEEVNIFDIQ